MEALSFAGLPTVLFLEPPTPRARRPLPRRPRHRPRRRRPHPQSRLDAGRAAGDLRRPARPRRADPALQDLLDSRQRARTSARSAPPPRSGSPTGGIAPLVVAAPRIGRWQAFGTLFARAGDGDPPPGPPPDDGGAPGHPDGRGRRPPPPRPPDLARARRSIDLVDLKAGRGPARLAEERARGTRIAALDVVDDETLAAAGALIWTERPGFVIGSQGVEYALVAAWRAAGLLAPPRRRRSPSRRSSGSPSSPARARRSPRRRSTRAEAAGFEVIDLDPHDPDWTAAADSGARRARATGRSPLVATARGASDPGVADGAALGAGLGRLLDRLVREAGLTRAVIAGGDTSSHAARALGLVALTAEAPVAPGAALLRGHRGRRQHARDRAEGRPDGAARLLRPSAGRPGNRRRNSRRMRRKRMTKIALMGAGGKMGVRLATNLMGTRFDVAPVEVAEAGRARLKAATGLDCIEQGQALSRADVVLLAVPDRAIGEVAHADRARARPRHRRHRPRRRRPARRRDARARRRHLLRHPPLPPADLQRRDRPGGEGRLLRRRRAPSSTSSAR